jgi:hypothetical protein
MRTTFCLAALVLATAWVPAANAQANPQAGSPAPGLSEPSAAITDQKLDAAAAALERVVSLQQEYRERLAGASGADEQERLIAEANNKLTKAVTDQGLSIEEYTSIMQVARNDPEIRGKIIQRIEPAAKQPADRQPADK